MKWCVLPLFMIWSALFSQAQADEIRPAYLQLSEQSAGSFAVLWKVPHKAGRPQRFTPRLPDGCSDRTAVNTRSLNGAMLQRWYVHCDDRLMDGMVTVDGLATSNTDVLLRWMWLDGSSSTLRLTPSEPFARVPEQTSRGQVAGTYLWLGVEHILLGVDHLLFVFALLLLVKDTRRLIATITAFTLAHSITLGAATLGYMHVPQQPVEAVIALSILFLAVELVHERHGRRGAAARWPWLVAFVFGLLHGFGFAGALAEVGLPEQAIPVALVFFNIGVELGQLLFVAAVLVLGYLLQRFRKPQLLAWGETATIYSIGGLASFWLLERLSGF